MQGEESVGTRALLPASHEQREFGEGCRGYRICHRHQYIARHRGGLARRGIRGAKHPELDAGGGPGGDNRGDGACDEYHKHCAVEYGLVHHPGAVGQHHVVTDCDHGQGHCRVGCRQAEHHTPVCRVHPVAFLGYVRGQPFAGQGHGEHHRRDPEGVAFDDDPHVDHHPYPDEEIGDEQRVAHKLYGVHERRAGGDIAVEHKPGEECPQHRLKTHHPRQPCRQEDHREDEDILGDFLRIALEEPARHPGVEIQHPGAICPGLGQQQQHPPDA